MQGYSSSLPGTASARKRLGGQICEVTGGKGCGQEETGAERKGDDSTVAGMSPSKSTYLDDSAYEENVDEEISRLGEANRLKLKGTAVAP